MYRWVSWKRVACFETVPSQTVRLGCRFQIHSETMVYYKFLSYKQGPCPSVLKPVQDPGSKPPQEKLQRWCRTAPDFTGHHLTLVSLQSHQRRSVGGCRYPRNKYECGSHTHTHTMGCLSCEDAFFALAGCLQPTNTTDRGCGSGPTGTYYHISLEGWTLGEGGENEGR